MAYRRLTLSPARRAFLAATLALSSAAALPAVSLAQTPPVQADGRRAYALPAGPLDETLASFAAASGVSITVAPALVEGRQAAALQGSFSVPEGFARLLAGSGLQAEPGPAGAYVLRRAPAVEGGVATLAAVSVTGQVLTTEGSGSYAAPGASIMKQAESLRDIPQSITVVTRQRMDDFNLQNMEDVLRQTPGLTMLTLGAGNKLFTSRGFEIRNMQVDGVSKGFWGGTSAMGIQPDMAMYDRVEVLRGAAGLLLGNGTPGGTVNFVRKRPLAENYLAVEMNAGSWDNYRSVIDGSALLNEAGTLRGRAVISYEDRGFYYSKTKSNQPFFYGVLEYDLSPATVLTTGARWQKYRKDGAYWYGGLPSSTDGSDLELPRSTSFGPDWAYYEARTQEYFAEARHQFNDRWSMKLAGVYQRTDRADQTLWVRGTADPQTLTGAYMVPSASDDELMQTKSVDFSVEGKFDALGREHSIVVGANRLEELGTVSSEYQYQTRIPLDLGNPHQVGVPRPSFNNMSYSDEKTVSQGVYSTLRLQLADPLKLVLGGRLSWYSYENRGDSKSAFKQNREFTPYAGVLYDLTPQWTTYASYADIFEPQSDQKTASGSPLKPALGSNYELGIKGELLDGRLNTSLALFYIRQNGRSMVDPDNATGCPASPSAGACYINAGKVESKGVEAEISGELMPGLQAWAGYTYNRQIYLKDRDSSGNPTSNEGRNFDSAAPRHMFRAGASYHLPGDWNKFTVGGSVNTQSDIGYLSSGVQRQQRGYAVWNAFVRYQMNSHWSWSLNVDNLFDRKYYTSAGQNLYGDPRNFMLTLRGQF